MNDHVKLIELERLYEMCKDHPIMGPNLKSRIKSLQKKLR